MSAAVRPGGAPRPAVGALAAVAAAGALLVLALVLVIGPGRLAPGDASVLELAVDLRASAGVRVAKALTELGTLWFTACAVVVACVVLVRRGRLPVAATLGAGYALMLAAEQLVRSVVDRPRPDGRLVAVTTASFPSAHAAHAVAWVAIAIAVGGLLPRPGARAAALAGGVAVAIAVALTRLYLHVHYLSDVLAGVALSAACFAVAGLLSLLVGHLRHNAASA